MAHVNPLLQLWASVVEEQLDIGRGLPLEPGAELEPGMELWGEEEKLLELLGSRHW
jgi:hypothetical protein